jgi:hypothetical protein
MLQQQLEVIGDQRRPHGRAVIKRQEESARHIERRETSKALLWK